MPETRPAGDLDDAESVVTGQTTYGGPVDSPDTHQTIYAQVVTSTSQPRRPILAAELRNPEQRRQAARLLAGEVGYHSAYHATRSPKYVGKVLLWAPWGLVRLVSRQVRWAWLTEQYGLRQQAATRGEAAEYLRLHNHARNVRAWRMPILGAEVLAVTGALVDLAFQPWWIQAPVITTVAGLLALHGRPAGKTVTDRVVIGERFVKLTAEMVRDAMCRIGIARIKEPGDITFAVPIHRDGPGWLARVNLPTGVTATEVLTARSRLSSAMRLPVDQVWPTKGPEHEGQIDLWVGYLPVSKMGQPKWSLAKPDARCSVFELEEFGSDQRQRPIRTSLFARNFLVGGRPGSGKSYAARTIATIAALDPTCELKILEYKGTGDFLDFEPLCSTYACGLSDEDFEAGANVLAWALVEAERRGARVKAARVRGEAPEGKVTPELARKPGSGLHPVVIVIDEAHELFGDPKYGKDAGEAAIRVAKRGRALGLILVICTQIPDKDSLPTGLTRVMGMRWCLAVSDYWANDAILGTGMHKTGVTATVYRPELDAGWGLVVGLSEPLGVRAQYPGAAVEKRILARAAQLRGQVVGTAVDIQDGRDVLDDVRRVFWAGEVFASWASITARLADLAPEQYADLTQDAVSALVRSYGLESKDGKEKGSRRTVKGLRLDNLTEVLSAREIGVS